MDHRRCCVLSDLAVFGLLPLSRLPLSQNELSALALGLTEPWYVASLALSSEQKTLEIGLDFRRGGTFHCPECSTSGCKAYDTEKRQLRDLPFTHLDGGEA